MFAGLVDLYKLSVPNLSSVLIWCSFVSAQSLIWFLMSVASRKGSLHMDSTLPRESIVSFIQRRRVFYQEAIVTDSFA